MHRWWSHVCALALAITVIHCQQPLRATPLQREDVHQLDIEISNGIDSSVAPFDAVNVQENPVDVYVDHHQHEPLNSSIVAPSLVMDAAVGMLVDVPSIVPADVLPRVTVVDPLVSPPVSPRRVREPSWIVHRPIPYRERRQTQMAEYSARHYGDRTIDLVPRVIVLHFTASSTLASAVATFANNSVHREELPGVCAHYIIDKDGTVYELVPPTMRCRHAIGLNHVAIGIEMVQQATYGSRWADEEILHRPEQLRAAVLLVRYLQRRFHIANEDVIGHAMANEHPLFLDLLGWRNDHGDWRSASVLQFRQALRTLR